MSFQKSGLLFIVSERGTDMLLPKICRRFPLDIWSVWLGYGQSSNHLGFFFHVFKSFCTSTSLCANFTIHRGKRNQRGHLGRFPRFFGTKVLGKKVNMSDLRVSSGGQANVAISPVHPFRLATATGIRPKILQTNHSISQTFLEFPKKLAVGSCQKK